MFKILITTTYYNGSGGCSVHTITSEFDSKHSADLALTRIQETREKNKYMYTQIAIALY